MNITRERDCLEELCSSLQVQAAGLDVCNADEVAAWFHGCVQVLREMKREAQESQITNFAICAVCREYAQLGHHSSPGAVASIIRAMVERSDPCLPV